MSQAIAASFQSLFSVGAYSVGNIIASVLTATRVTWKLFSVLPLVFACYHVAYGYGFLRGVWDFVILRRAPNRTCTDLTRSSGDLS